MDNHLAKFALLGAVVMAVLFSRSAYHENTPLNLAKVTGAAIDQGVVPRFVLPSVSASEPVTTHTDPSVETSTPEAKATPPTVNDTAFLVANLRTGTVFASANPNRRWPTASITKLMTATVALDKLALDARISITPSMFAVDPTEQTLVVGGTYTVSDLLHVMLLPSSNVAAEALADFYGHDAFMSIMNGRAAAWGMTSTFYGDPSGLSVTNQSTADDFLKLAQKIYTDYPQIFAITRTPSFTITEEASGKFVAVKSINSFAGEADFIGGKTGYTDEAEGNLLSVFRDGNEPIFVLVLGTYDRFGDTERLYNWFKVNVPA